MIRNEIKGGRIGKYISNIQRSTHAIGGGERDFGFVQWTHDLIDQRRRVVPERVYEIEVSEHNL